MIYSLYYKNKIAFIIYRKMVKTRKMRKTEKNGGEAEYKKNLNFVKETKEQNRKTKKMEEMEELKKEHNGELRDQIIKINAKMVEKIFTNPQRP